MMPLYDEAHFQGALGTKAAVFYFKASWCEPCKELTPIVDRLWRKQFDPLPEKGDMGIPFYVIDIDKYPQIKEQMKVKAVPMILFVDKEGKTKAFSFGLQTFETLQKKFDIFKRTINA